MTTATEYWSKRHDTYGDGWAEFYWNSHHLPHRFAIVETLQKLPAFGSLLEVGCNAGPNIRLIRQCFPHVSVTGLELNEAAINRGRLGFKDDPLVRFIQGDVRDFPDTHYDLVLSCYVLAYVEPDELPAVLAALLARTDLALVLAEPVATPGLPAGVTNEDIPEYRHDYASVLESLGMDWKSIRVHELIEPVEHLNAIVVASKEFTPIPSSEKRS